MDTLEIDYVLPQCRVLLPGATSYVEVVTKERRSDGSYRVGYIPLHGKAHIRTRTVKRNTLVTLYPQSLYR